jgi:phosphopantothenoylcysteine decarboxylase/phosphopantothenate--cysteine ligase
MLSGKKIVIAVTGSIAAYKSAYLIRLLVKKGSEVQVIMTESAKDFISPLTLSTLSKRPVISTPFNPQDGSWTSHVDLGVWADLMIFAPLTANTMAKMAHGLADNFVTTAFLSARCPVFFAPAMDVDMFNHPATMDNITRLKSLGCILIEPQVGELASGLSGEGRMEEPERIVELLELYLTQQNDLAGKKVLVTAGPTHEPIDLVRYIGNYSTGSMGFSIAEEASRRGADVILITGPTALECQSSRIQRIDVVTSGEMMNACMAHFPTSDICIMAAAVADFKPVHPSGKKLKKNKEISTLELEPTVDILFQLGQTKKTDQLLIGFALETDNEVEHAKMKLKNKNLDFIVLNSLNDPGAGFGFKTNKISILDKSGEFAEYELKPKKEVAADILDKITGRK